MITKTNPISFSPEDKRRLKALSVTSEQIEALEEKVLTKGRRILSERAPTLRDRREEADKLQKALDAAQSALSELMGQDIPDKAEILERVEKEIFGAGGNANSLHAAIAHISFVASAVSRARSSLPPSEKQARQRNAWMPIVLIENILNPPSSSGTSATTIKPSVLDNSPFRQVVDICYNAMTQADCPDRSLKYFGEYMKGKARSG